MEAVADGGGLPPSSFERTGWVDVSHLIEAACADLQDGELIHGENFSLFAAMSALEVGDGEIVFQSLTTIMDPKMDSGMESVGYRSVEEAIGDGAAPVNLDVQSTIDIERTSSHALLHSYCRIIHATCNALISAVSDARTHEEEDLFVMAYGLPMKKEGDEKCLSVLNSVEETINRQLRASKAPSSKKKILEGEESLQTNPDLEEGYCKAILSRLRFHEIFDVSILAQHFFHVLGCMRKPRGTGLELARKHIVSCLAELARVRKSSEYLTSTSYLPHGDDLEEKTTASGCNAVGFDVNINCRMLAPTPPRAIKILSWKKAIEYFEKLLHSLDVICSLHLDQMLEGVLHFVVQFQLSQPDLVARSYMQLLLVQDGKLFGRDPIIDVISRAAALPELSKNQEFQKTEFVVQLGKLVVNLLKVLCTNAAWQRRKLGKILQDWSVTSVQLELALEKEYKEVSNVSFDENSFIDLSKRLLAWAEEQTYWIASRFLVLGFELELYSSSEYCMVYWQLEIAQLKIVYNSDNSPNRQYVLHRIVYIFRPNTIDDSICQPPQDIFPAKRKGKKKRDFSKEAARDAQISSSILLLQCYICLSEGLAMMLAALSNEHKAFQPPNAFNTEEEGVMKDNYFRDVQRISTLLRSRIPEDSEKLTEIRQIEQVAEHNRIAVNVINQARSYGSSLRVSFEFSQHPFFAVAVVKRS
ncbi:hypothetical protein QJS04_geneDACA001526 [Acorus gramineus]|uniref:NAA35-like TPR repeats domain-containing protein n=1 Tax=Acorus gramineus TaxID=55184 RepID=A0AAV9BG33_ACOGR|nr:hypothetical protein QJS04_geneDACA001526 [Acorus gramineus]